MLTHTRWAHPRLEVELELAAHGRMEAVEKLTESRAGVVILHFAGVEMVSGVKNGHAHSRSSPSDPRNELWYAKPFVTCTASDRNVGKRPARLRGPTKSRRSLFHRWTSTVSRAP